MDQELNKAIKIIEDRGGFVMFPENESEERDMRKVTHALEIQKEKEDEEETLRLKEESESDIAKRKKAAFKEMNEVFYEPRFMSRGILNQVEEMEDILLDNGLEMDYLEDWIESQI